MRGTRIFTLGVTLGLTVIAGCAESTGPEGSIADQTYVLQTMGGKGLPATVIENENGRFIAIADTLRFSGSGKVTRIHVMRRVNAPSPISPDTTYRSVRELSYRFERGRVWIGFDCPLNANCIGPATGMFSQRGLLLAGPILYPSQILTYKRISGR